MLHSDVRVMAKPANANLSVIFFVTLIGAAAAMVVVLATSFPASAGSRLQSLGGLSEPASHSSAVCDATPLKVGG